MERRVGLAITDARVHRRASQCLARHGLRVEALADPDEAPPPPTALLEVVEVSGPALALIGRLAALRPRPAILVLCPRGRIEVALSALKQGADDFVFSDFDFEELGLKLRRAWEQRRLREELEQLRGPAMGPGSVDRPLLGENVLMREVRDKIARVAPGRTPVLITGETGTGKELVATAIHETSPRRHRRMVKVNCAALPDPLLESELFGHERGAFTGAEQRRIGRFEEAHRGTLFLDEIGDMHPRTQAKVLRALQEQEFERLGGTQPIRVDVRVITATNQDLLAAISQGRFRQDLFFRLNVVSIELPPLRLRVADIPELARWHLARLPADRSQGPRRLAAEALEALMRHSWPGNVRELFNILERAALMSDTQEIQVSDLELRGPASEPLHASSLGLRLPAGGMSRRRLNYCIGRLGITHPGWRSNVARTEPPESEGGGKVC